MKCEIMAKYSLNKAKKVQICYKSKSKNYFLIVLQMSNPWQVENLNAFSYFCCPECVYRSQEEANFEAHAIQHHPQSRIYFSQIKEEILETEIDPILFKSEEIEEKPEISEDLFECNFCSEKFENSKELKYHLKNEHSSDNFKCEHCEKEFKSALKLSNHQEKEHAEIECKLCQKVLFRHEFAEHYKGLYNF